MATPAAPARPRPAWCAAAVPVVVPLVAMALLLVLLRWFAVDVYTVESSSMAPSLGSGDRLLVTKVGAVRPGDVIVFRHPSSWAGAGDPAGELLVKRVLAVGGQTISCCEHITGRLVVDDSAVAEEYLDAHETIASSIAFDVRVPDDAVWVLGDNRQNSIDSRAHLLSDGAGSVPSDDVIGVVRRVWPR